MKFIFFLTKLHVYKFKSSKPFNHCIVENLFKTEVAKKLENEFPDFNSNIWHGLPQKICCPENEYRKSLAIYYLCKPQQGISDRGKALFSPSEEQRKDEIVYELIRKRSSIRSASSVYVEDSK